MARMETNRSESTTITVRVHPDLKEQYEDALGEQNVSDDIRDHMRETADVKEAENDGLPTDEEQRTAFLALERMSNRRNKVPTETALSQVANKLNLPKETVKGAVFEDMREAGYLEACWGKVRVRRQYDEPQVDPTPTSQPEVPADD